MVLPGDKRGFRTHRSRPGISPPARYAHNGETLYDPQKYDSLHNNAVNETGKSIRLNNCQMEATYDVIAETALKFTAAGIIAVGHNHVHILAKLLPEMTTGFFCNRVKSKSSLRLSDYGLEGRVWARRYHAKRIADNGVKRRLNM
ncbi:MAG: transposase [Planctomycetota bacterium]